MDFQQWSLLAGLSLSMVLAVAPWMFKVHAKLAVIASKVADLCDKLDRQAEEHHELWHLVHQHTSRLDAHEIQLGYAVEQLKSVTAD